MHLRKFNFTKGITHGGTVFHSDDVFATALCKYFAEKEGLSFEASRQINVTEEEINNPNIIIYDIGKIYNPEIGLFDHHQKETPIRKDGQKYSACGLILKDFGPTYFTEKELSVLQNITTLIDYHDNGKLFANESKPEEIYEFSFFAPTWNENPQLQTEYFNNAVNLALKTIKYEINLANGIDNKSLKQEITEQLMQRETIQENARKDAEKIAVNSLDTLDNGIVTLPCFAPVRDIYANPDFLETHNVENIIFIIYPGDRDPFTTQIVPAKPNVFDLKIPEGFNTSLDKDENEKFILPDGITFVHATGFLAACETYESAIELCNNTLKEYNNTLSIEK